METPATYDLVQQLTTLPSSQNVDDERLDDWRRKQGGGLNGSTQIESFELALGRRRR